MVMVGGDSDDDDDDDDDDNDTKFIKIILKNLAVVYCLHWRLALISLGLTEGHCMIFLSCLKIE